MHVHIGLPQPNGGILGTRGQHFAVWRELNVQHRFLRQRTSRHVHRPVNRTTARQAATKRRHTHIATHTYLVPYKTKGPHLGLEVIDVNTVVTRCRRQLLHVGVEGHTVDGRLVASKSPLQLSWGTHHLQNRMSHAAQTHKDSTSSQLHGTRTCGS